MLKANYENKKFGLLMVMECLLESDGNNKGGLWLCKCKCGGTITLSGYRLHSRNSCGCLGKKAAKKRGIKNRKSKEEKLITKNYQKYKRLCRYKKIISLNKEKWLTLISNPCAYCGSTEIREDLILCQLCKEMSKGLSKTQFINHIRQVLLRTDAR